MEQPLSLNLSPSLSHPTPPPAFWTTGQLMTIKLRKSDTAGELGAMETLLPPNVGVPPHIHHRESEVNFVLEGRMRFTLDGQVSSAGPVASCTSRADTPTGSRRGRKAPACWPSVCQAASRRSMNGSGSGIVNDGSPRSRPTLPGGWRSAPNSEHRGARAAARRQPAASLSGRPSGTTGRNGVASAVSGRKRCVHGYGGVDTRVDGAAHRLA